MAYSVIKNHGGLITVDSAVGQGTTFHLYLPAAAGMPAECRGTAEATTNPPGQGLDGSMLIMDDEEIMRDLFSAFARELGYTPVAAAEGGEALRLYEQAMAAAAPFALAIVDLTVPGGMGGREMIDRLLALDPQAKAIVSSGYSTDPIMAEYARYGFVGVAPKPTTFSEFAAVIGAALKK